MSATHLSSDRLADAAGRSSGWTNQEAAHLAACAECRLELELVLAARRLGTAEVAKLDPARVAAGVRTRLAADPPPHRDRGPRRPGRWLAGLAAAAAVIFVVRLGFDAPDPGSGDSGLAPQAEISVLHELDGLSEPQLEAVLASLPPAADAMTPLPAGPIGELNADDLERVLRSMEE